MRLLKRSGTARSVGRAAPRRAALGSFAEEKCYFARRAGFPPAPFFDGARAGAGFDGADFAFGGPLAPSLRTMFPMPRPTRDGCVARDSMRAFSARAADSAEGDDEEGDDEEGDDEEDADEEDADEAEAGEAEAGDGEDRALVDDDAGEPEGAPRSRALDLSCAALGSAGPREESEAFASFPPLDAPPEPAAACVAPSPEPVCARFSPSR